LSRKVFFDRVDLLLVSAKSQYSSSLRQSLSDLEFRNIRNAETVDDVLKALETRPPDFMISDYQLADGVICDVIRDIRHNRVGINPFMSIIVTTWEPTEALVREVADCGADDLLVQPASRKQLSHRVKMLTYHRKHFVVTSNYIGPDRRNGPRPGKQVIEPKEVPNVMQARVLGKDASSDIQREIDKAIEALNLEKIVRNVSHIGYQTQQLLAAIRHEDDLEKINNIIDDILMTSGETRRRLGNTDLQPVSKLCQSISDVAERVRERLDDPLERDLKLMPALAMSLRLAVKDKDENADTVNEISEAIAAPVTIREARTA